MEKVQLPLYKMASATLKITQAIRNACQTDKTNEVNIFFIENLTGCIQ